LSRQNNFYSNSSVKMMLLLLWIAVINLGIENVLDYHEISNHCWRGSFDF